jgi:hypothetical protein
VEKRSATYKQQCSAHAGPITTAATLTITETLAVADANVSSVGTNPGRLTTF